MNLDQFFTPADACAAAYRSYRSNQGSLRIGDFACGNGSLLDQAPFINKHVYGVDVDPQVINHVRASHPDWNLCVGDFLDPDPNLSEFLSLLTGTLDLVVLNPPYSCRGSRTFATPYLEDNLRCSKAMAFLLRSVPLLRLSGSLMAILPKSSLRSDKDAPAIEAISRDWSIEVQQEFSRNTFSGCFPQAVCISMRRRKASERATPASTTVSRSTAPSLRIVRGCIPIHDTSSSGLYKVLHTTDLRRMQPMSVIDRFANRPGRMVSGTVIILPRVGAPDLRKVRLLDIDQPITLSDCLLALVPEAPSQAPSLVEAIVRNWERLEAQYASTCAPYITLSQVDNFVRQIGWNAVPAFPEAIGSAHSESALRSWPVSSLEN